MKKHMIFAKKYLLAVILSIVCSFMTMQTAEAMEIDKTQEEAETKLSIPELTMAYAKTNSTAKISWQQLQYAQGYEVYSKAPGGGWKKVKAITKSKTTTYTQKKLKSGKTYKYKVRAYRKVNGQKIYSDYSNPFTVKMKKPTVKGTYKSGSVYGARISNNKLNEIRRVVQGFKDNYIKKGMSDYDKALAAFNYIRANCSYAWKGWQYNEANTAWGALVYGEAQCSGYARGMVALCDAVGIKCKYVHANSKAINPSHQWNMIKMGKKWYIVDAQGGFFLVGSETYMQTGMRWDKKGLPSCSSKDHSKGGFAGSEV